MFFPNIEATPRLVPPAWALSVEVFFYVCICAGLSKTLARVCIWLLLSVAYVVYSFCIGESWQHRYYPIAAASLPFALGSAIFFFRNRPWNRLFFKYSEALFSACIVNALVGVIVSKMAGGQWPEINYYANMVIVALLLNSLMQGGKILRISPKTDKYIGDYSYPIYLFHWLAGLMVSAAVFGSPTRGFSVTGLLAFPLSLFVTLILAWVTIQILDKPIQGLRKANRPSSMLSYGQGIF